MKIKRCSEEDAIRIFGDAGIRFASSMTSFLGTGGMVKTTLSNKCQVYTPDARIPKGVWVLNGFEAIGNILAAVNVYFCKMFLLFIFLFFFGVNQLTCQVESSTFKTWAEYRMQVPRTGVILGPGPTPYCSHFNADKGMTCRQQR